MSEPVAGDPGGASVRANFLALAAGRIIAALAQWLALIALTKLADVGTVGAYGLAMAICIPITEVARMGLREVRASDVQHEFRFRDYMGMRAAATAIAVLAMAATGWVLADDATGFAVVCLYALSRGIELISDMIYGLFQLQERLDLVGRSLALQAPLSLTLLAGGYAATGSLQLAVAGQVLAHLVVLLGYDVRVARQRLRHEPAGDSLWPRFDAAVLRRLVRPAAPLLLASLLAMTALHWPRIAVKQELGVIALGFFLPLLQPAMAPSRLVHALGAAATARLARLHVGGQRRAFVRLIASMMTAAGAVGAIGLLIAWAAGEWVLTLLYRQEYAAYQTVFVLVVAGGALRYVAEALQYGMIAARGFWWLALQYGSAAVVAVVACALLLPERGLEGAGCVVLAVSATQLAVVGGGVLCHLPRAAEATP